MISYENDRESMFSLVSYVSSCMYFVRVAPQQWRRRGARKWEDRRSPLVQGVGCVNCTFIGACMFPLIAIIRRHWCNKTYKFNKYWSQPTPLSTEWRQLDVFSAFKSTTTLSCCSMNKLLSNGHALFVSISMKTNLKRCLEVMLTVGKFYHRT